MNLTPFYSTGVSSNIYLIEDEKKLLIDAGMEDPGLRTEDGLDILILTHCHFDHSAMAKDIQDKTGCEIWMSGQEAEFFEEDRSESSAAVFFDFDVDLDFTVNRKLKTGDVLSLGKTRLETIVTPGHTPGGLCLYEPESKSLFSGDTVFAQGFGRYDLMGGDREALRESIRKLSELGVNALYPGHGPAREGDVNEYIKSISL